MVRVARHVVDVARGVAAVQRVIGAERLAVGEEDLEEAPNVRVQDDVVDTLRRLMEARRLLLRGSVVRAERVLSAGPPVDALPEPVGRLVLFEQALAALLGSDWVRLGTLEAVLARRGDAAESALVAGLRADAMGDPRAASQLYAAAAGQARAAQPPTEAMALACRAQLLDAEGRHEEALSGLAAAVAATRTRRTALPFLGWSRHGSPVAGLLQSVAMRMDSDWARQLAADSALAKTGGIVASAAVLTPTPHERAQVPEGVLRPSLSPRERDVLLELARGSTYADIAANLYLSENTVKTHVSSLYSKLAVNRRSDALAVARTLRLL
jgi:DNA-binding CsgD family transcriptional regulator